MTEPFIKVEHLTKYYSSLLALADVSFDVQKGEIVGLLGPNGAGKTTLMQMLCSVLIPSNGDGWLCGNHIVKDSLESRRILGYCSEKSPLYTDMSVYKYLKFACLLKEVKTWKKKIGRIIEELGLESVAQKQIGKLSKGYRQRVSLAQALINDPLVLIMDEPTIGLDPEQVKETRTLIKRFSHERATLISTHVLHEGGILCDRLIILNEGRVLAIDSPDRLERSLGGFHTIRLKLEGPENEVKDCLEGISGVQDIISKNGSPSEHLTDFSLKTIHPEYVVREVSKFCMANQWIILELCREQRSLEDLFHEIVAGEK